MRLYPETTYMNFPDYRPQLSSPLPGDGLLAIWFPEGAINYEGLRLAKRLIDIVLSQEPAKPAPITEPINAPGGDQP